MMPKRSQSKFVTLRGILQGNVIYTGKKTFPVTNGHLFVENKLFF